MDQFYYSVLILLISGHPTFQGEISLQRGEDALVGLQNNVSVADLLHNDSSFIQPSNPELGIQTELLDIDPLDGNRPLKYSEDLTNESKNETELSGPVSARSKVKPIGNIRNRIKTRKAEGPKKIPNTSESVNSSEYGDEKSASYRHQMFIEHPINPGMRNQFNRLPNQNLLYKPLPPPIGPIYQNTANDQTSLGYPPETNGELSDSVNTLAASEDSNSAHTPLTTAKRPNSDFFSQNFRRPSTTADYHSNSIYHPSKETNGQPNSINTPEYNADPNSIYSPEVTSSKEGQNSIYSPEVTGKEVPDSIYAPVTTQDPNDLYSPEVTTNERPNLLYQPALTPIEYSEPQSPGKTKESFRNLYSKKSFGQSRSNFRNQKSIFPATAPAEQQDNGLSENSLKFNENANNNDWHSARLPQRSIFPATAPAEQQNSDLPKSNEEPRWKRRQNNYSPQPTQLSATIPPEIEIAQNFQQVPPSQFSFPRDENSNENGAQVTPAPLIFKFNSASRQQGTLRPISFPPRGNKNYIQQTPNFHFKYNNQPGLAAPVPQGTASPTTFQPNYNYNFQPPGRPMLQFPPGNVQHSNAFQAPTSTPFQANYNGLQQTNIAQQVTSSPGQSNFFPNYQYNGQHGRPAPVNVFVQNAGQRSPTSQNPPIFPSQSQSQVPQESVRDQPQSVPGKSIFPTSNSIPQEITVKYQHYQETTTTKPFQALQQHFNNYPQQFAQQQYVEPQTTTKFDQDGVTPSSVPVPSAPAFQQYSTPQIYTNFQQQPQNQKRSFSHPDVPFTGPRPFPTSFPMNTVQQFRSGLSSPNPNSYSPDIPFYQREPYYSTPGNPSYQQKYSSTELPALTTPAPTAGLLTKPFKIEIEIPPFKPADLDGYIPSKTGANYTMPDLSTEVIKYPVEFKESMLHHQYHPKDSKQSQPGPAQYDQNLATAQYNPNSGSAQYRQNSGPASPQYNSGPAQYRQNFGPASPQYNPGPAQYRQNSGPASPQYNPGPAQYRQNSGPASPQYNSGPAQYNPNSVSPQYSSGVGQYNPNSASPQYSSGAGQYNPNSASPQYNSGVGQYNPNSAPPRYNSEVGQYNPNSVSAQYVQNSGADEYNPTPSPSTYSQSPLSTVMGLDKENYRTKKIFKRKPKDKYEDPKPNEGTVKMEPGDLSKENNGNATQSGEDGQVSSGTFTYLSRIFGLTSTTTTQTPLRMLSPDIVDIRQIFFTTVPPKVDVVKRSTSPKPEKNKSSKSGKKKETDEQQMESQDTPAESQTDDTEMDSDDSETKIKKNEDLGKNEVDGNATLENETVEVEKETETKPEKAKNINEKLKKAKDDESPEDNNTTEEVPCKNKKSKKSESKAKSSSSSSSSSAMMPQGSPEVQVRILWPKDGQEVTSGNTVTPFKTVTPLQVLANSYPQFGNTMRPQEGLVSNNWPYNELALRHEIPFHSESQKRPQESVQHKYQSVVTQAPAAAVVQTSTESPGIARSVGKFAGGVVRNVSRMVQFFG